MDQIDIRDWSLRPHPDVLVAAELPEPAAPAAGWPCGMLKAKALSHSPSSGCDARESEPSLKPRTEDPTAASS